MSAAEIESARQGRRRLTLLLLVAVVAVYALAQVVLFDESRHYEYDEAVYVSQVRPDIPALETVASRARGITLLVAPVTVLTGALPPLRAWLILTSSLALFGAFWVWRRIDDRVAVLGAALFGSTWLVLFYGSEVTPNLYSALGCVALAGLAISALGTARRGQLAAIVGVGALAGLFRPYDVLLGGVGIFVGLLFARGTVVARPEGRPGVGRWTIDPAAVRVLVALALAVVAGWIPWWIEMSIRFGGPIEALRSAVIASNNAGTSEWGIHVFDHLRATDGPIFRVGPPAIPLGGVAWWTLWTGLGVTAVLRRWREPARLATLVAGLAVAGGYFLITPIAARFLLPAYGLIAVAVGFGIVEVAGMARGRITQVIAVALAGILVWSAAWHVALADDIESDQVGRRIEFLYVGRALAEATGGEECAFWSEWGLAAIAVTAGCPRGGRLDPDRREPPGDVVDAAADHGVVYLLSSRRPARSSFLRTLPETRIPIPDGSTWFLYEYGAGG